MTEKEITNNVSKNGGDYHYILILSQLNSCTMDDIVNILKKHNFVFYDGEWHAPKRVFPEPAKRTYFVENAKIHNPLRVGWDIYVKIRGNNKNKHELD